MPGELTVFSALQGAVAVKRVTTRTPRALSGIDGGPRGGWSDLFIGSARPPGYFQTDIHCSPDTALANWAVFSCITLIASDIGKLRLKLVEFANGIWTDAQSAAFSPVLRRPNAYQTPQKFIEQWVVSKLCEGNTYVLKERDASGIVRRLHVLDPRRVTVHMDDRGNIFYRLSEDDLAQVRDGDVYVPASEIIHDSMVCLYGHPLVGISPIVASGLAALQGLDIQKNAIQFFRNGSRPGGILTAPGRIPPELADRLKEHWDTNYSGDKAGSVAVLGDGLKYEPMGVSGKDSQMNELLLTSAQMVCSTFHVPPFKIGVGSMPAGQKVEDMNRIYYADCLQTLMKGIENQLDFGLGLDEPKEGKVYGTMFHLDDLLEMDTASLTTALSEQVGAGITKPNEARLRLNMGPVPGGDTPYLQQQNYGLEALLTRDRSPDPFAAGAPPAAPKPEPAEGDEALAVIVSEVRAQRDVIAGQGQGLDRLEAIAAAHDARAEREAPALLEAASRARVERLGQALITRLLTAPEHAGR